jgi:hypothetical protein
LARFLFDDLPVTLIQSLPKRFLKRPLKDVHAELGRLRESANHALGPLAGAVSIEDTQLL